MAAGRGRRALDGALVAALVMAAPLAPPAAAQAQPAAQSPAAQPAGPAVRIRTGEHVGYVRIVFDWPQLVDYQVTDAGGTVALRFAGPSRIDAAALQGGRAPKGVRLIGSAQEGGATIVRLAVPAGTSIRHFRDGSNIVLDVLDAVTPAATPPAQAPSVPAPQPPAQARQQPQPPLPPAGRPPVLQPAVPQAAAPQTPPPQAVAPQPVAPQAVAPQVAPPRPAQPPAANPPAQANVPPQPAPPPPPPVAAAPPPAAAGPVFPTPQAAPRMAVEASTWPPLPRMRPGSEPLPEQQAGDRQVGAGEAGPAVGPIPIGLPEAPPLPTGPLDPLVPQIEPGAEGPMLRFPFPEPVQGAGFMRNGRFWVVFSRPTALDMAPVREREDLFAGAAQLPHAQATVMRFTPPAEHWAALIADDRGWAIALRQGKPQGPPTALEVKRGEQAGGENIFLPVPEPASPIPLADPEVGDGFWAVPTLAGRGTADERVYVQFTLPRTYQGVVVQPRADGVTVASTRETVEIGAASGLILSRGAVLAGGGGALMKFGDWRRGGFDRYVENKQALEYVFSQARPEARNAARFDLARFYVAWNMNAEALSVLREMQRADPSIERDRNFRALRGLARLGLHRLDDAAVDLNHVSLATDPDMVLWRGVLQTWQHDYQAARRSFQDGRDALQYYPQDVVARIRLAMAEAFYRTGDLQAARDEFEQIDDNLLSRSDDGAADLLRSRVYLEMGEAEPAQEFLDQALNSGSRLVRVQAEYDQIERELAEKKIQTRDAINRLDRLRYAWRGDDFEIKLLRRLGELQIEDGDYRNGLLALKQVAQNFPKSREGVEARRKMSEVFEKLFLQGGADALSPVTALGLFYDFRELTPSGARGDEMIRKLADRLAQVDLLGRAAELLDHQVRNRLRGDDKARAAVRLAVIQLLDKRAEAALKTIQDTAGPDFPPAIQVERKHLEARALADLGRYPEALAALQGDDTREGDLLRADIYWRQKDWQKAAASLQTTLSATAQDPAKPLDGIERRRLLELAVALALADDRRALEQLRNQWTERMKGSAEADAFQVITAAVDPADADGIRQRTSAIAQINQLESFMASYRDKLSRGGVSAIN